MNLTFKEDKCNTLTVSFYPYHPSFSCQSSSFAPALTPTCHHHLGQDLSNHSIYKNQEIQLAFGQASRQAAATWMDKSDFSILRHWEPFCFLVRTSDRESAGAAIGSIHSVHALMAWNLSCGQICQKGSSYNAGQRRS